MCTIAFTPSSDAEEHSAPSSAQRFIFELGALDVSPTKPNGKQWDIGIGSIARPDLTVSVMMNRREILKSQKCANTFSCTFDDRSEPFELNSQSVLRVEVWDQDLKHDDLIDRFYLTISKDVGLEGADVELKGKSTSLLNVRLIPQ
jgi:hypothetical protein